ncbi:MAG: hypothetical protein KAR56_01185 [Thermoplasmata archaeon]|nr:hypothetical protein [Thermoplasmata archaeon]
MKKDTKLATTTDRIFLYLLEFKSYEDEIDGPMELTQIGIAKAIGVARGNVTRAIQPSIEDGWIESHKVHVSGIRLKRIIYYLSGTGYNKAHDIKKELDETQIRLIDQDGEETKVKLGNIIQHIPFEINFVEIVREVNKTRTFDCQEFLNNQKQEAVELSSHLREKIRIDHLYGRQNEMKIASEWLKSPSCHTLIVKGMPGIGKTTLLSYIMDGISECPTTYFFRIQTWCTVRAIIKSLSQFFENQGKRELKRYLTENNRIDMSEVEYLLMESLSEQSILMVFDDYHNANNDVQTFFSMLQKLITRYENIKLVVAGMGVDSFYDRQDVAVSKSVIEITLEGLDKESTEILARNMGISEKFIEDIHAKTEGHPLFVKLLGNGGMPEMNMDLEKFINEEFVQILNERELELLKYLSVHRYPAHRSDLHAYQHIITNLTEQSIIKQSEDDYVELHDMIKTALYRRLSEKDIERFHSKAAEHYLEDLSINSLMEVLYHLLKTERYNDVIEILLDKEEKLLKSDRLEELARALTILLGKSFDIEKQEKARLLYMQGQALSFIGEWDEAIMHYNRAMVLASDNEKLIMKTKSGTAEISLRRNNYSIAQSLFEDILEWADKNNEMEMKAESSYYLGSVHELLWDNELALDYFKKSLKISFKTNNKNQIAKAYYGQGRLFHRRQEYEKALESKNKALDIALKIGNKQIASKILTSIGNTLDRMEQLEDEINAHERAIVLARETGAVRTLAYALSNAGAAYLDKSELNLSQKYLDEAAIIFEKLGETTMYATTNLNKAIIALYKGDMDRAINLFNECDNILNMIENKEKLVDSYHRFGLALKKSNYLDEAKAFFEKALAISSELKDTTTSRQITKDIKQLKD